MPSQPLRLDAITLDARLQPRAELDDGLWYEYAAAYANGAVFPPVAVFQDGDAYLLADGYHRWHASNSLGLDSIEADVRPGGWADALLFSIQANAAHGKRREAADYARAYAMGVAHGLFDEADTMAVAVTLACSERTADRLTIGPRYRQQEARDNAIRAAKAVGKSERQIAEAMGFPRTTVQRVLAGGPKTSVAETGHLSPYQVAQEVAVAAAEEVFAGARDTQTPVTERGLHKAITTALHDTFGKPPPRPVPPAREAVDHTRIHFAEAVRVLAGENGDDFDADRLGDETDPALAELALSRAVAAYELLGLFIATMERRRLPR